VIAVRAFTKPHHPQYILSAEMLQPFRGSRIEVPIDSSGFQSTIPTRECHQHFKMGLLFVSASDKALTGIQFVDLNCLGNCQLNSIAINQHLSNRIQVYMMD
jgi:hypothetical protein